MLKSDIKLERKKERRAVKIRVLGEKVDSFLLFERDDDILEMMRHNDPKLEKAFSQSLHKYKEGDWLNAYEGFLNCLKLNPLDGPSLTLKNYI